MERIYRKPNAVVVELNFYEHIAGSGTDPTTSSSCVVTWTHNTGEACSDVFAGIVGPKGTS